MTTAPALRPCPVPWCGVHDARVAVTHSAFMSDWRVQCLRCGCHGPRHNDKAQAIAAWNARPGGDEADEWEYFCDESHFDFWCVRRIGDRTFGQGYHMQNGNEAKHLCETLNAQATALRARAQMERGE